jgi:phosphate/sulfate permease
MSPKVRVQHRLNVVLQMVMALITAILLGQLWLFTITLEAMDNNAVSPNVAGVAAVCSLVACGSIWILIRFFLRMEQSQSGDLR